MHLRPVKQGLYDPANEHDACGVGFVCDVKGNKTNKIVADALEVLRRLEHRGATGADPLTGDGAGILMQIPHKFLQKVSESTLPAEGEYACGIIFLPADEKEALIVREKFEKIISEEGQKFIEWRKVPVDNSVIGVGAKEAEPIVEQIFISKDSSLDNLGFERKLYVIRKRIENEIKNSELELKKQFYINSLSSKTILYKGQLTTAQLWEYYKDLNDSDMESAIALVHSRYSTNTFPSWDLAQPFRFLCHNGEINTLRGNFNWMSAREGLLKSDAFGEDIKKLFPILTEGASDSAILDNALELLVLSGRSLPHSIMMLIPGAWENHKDMDPKLIDFYKYHACMMEPWDGPAAVAFTDGRYVGAILDRNGLRPARYILTNSGQIYMGSEVGVADLDIKDVKVSGRLEPGKIFYVDTEEGKIVDDEEIKDAVSTQKDYSAWVKDNLLDLNELEKPESTEEKSNPFKLMKTFGYSREDVRLILADMAQVGTEPTYSMGNDCPHAILSHRPKLLYTYFKQLFAQVTNPAIDPIREKIVMSMRSFVGMQHNILEENPLHAKKIDVKEPILFDDDLKKIINIKEDGFKSKIVSTLFDVEDETDFLKAIDRICEETEKAVEDGYTFVILSDKGVNENKTALPALLAMGAVHHHLIRKEKRTRIGIILQTAEPKEVHHFALLFGYGADLINPYMAYETIRQMVSENLINVDEKDALKNYRKALNKGILKILSKVGISTLRSYRGAQIFEALGIHDEVIERCFAGTPSRIGGADFDIIRKETIMRHKEAFNEKVESFSGLDTGGCYQWKKDGEYHLWNPESIATLQHSTKNSDYHMYKQFASLINNQSKNPATLRGLLKFKETEKIPIEEVEPAEDIMKRFVTGAMSFGSISKGAHESLAVAMNRIGGKSNTGEGGEDTARFVPLPNGDSKRSAIKQVASGRFGVTINYLSNADEIQIKIAQGAKPGEGGQLPGHKVSATIAKVRYTTPGVTLISPPPHHDIYSIEDLKQLIFDLKNTNPAARISVKLVSENGVGTIAAGVAKGYADMILISGGDGGTGASPLTSLRHAGLPWELGLSETHQTLVINGLRSRVRIQTDGQMRTGRDVVIAALLGAEEYGFCTSALIVMGCVMLRHCHLNTCSLGVATQDDMLQKRFQGDVEHVVDFMKFVAEECREIMAELGIRKIDDLVGRTDLLELNKAIIPWKASKLDYSKILFNVKTDKREEVYCTKKQNHEVDNVLDKKLIELAKPAIENNEKVNEEIEIKNLDRTTGAMLSGAICKARGEGAFNDDTIHFKFKGYAGQSFGAWLAKGITFELVGMSNDYIGKGISGGKIIVYQDSRAPYVHEDNVIVGNTTFYGAISGEAYIRGKAGERFCIRNSGLYGVVEGVGDHGCEYMTGGKVVILGETGRNFAAGMSGGVAYVLDEDNTFEKRCNKEMVDLDKLEDDDIKTLKTLINNHLKYTKSPVAEKILNSFDEYIGKFVKVIPVEYKKIIEAKKTGLSEVSDG